MRGEPGWEPWTEDGREDRRGDWSRDPSNPSAARTRLTDECEGGLAEDWALLEPEVWPEEEFGAGRSFWAFCLEGPAMVIEVMRCAG